MSAPVPLPIGRHLAVTWGLATEFGGMTSALLRRSRSFAEQGRPVDVVTFDLRDDYRDVERNLRERGLLSDGVRHLNFWDDLTDRSDAHPKMAGAAPKALTQFEPLPAGGESGPTRTRLADDGTVLQVDRVRSDGSLAISDRRDTKTAGVLGGRSTVLCDADGSPVVGFTRIRPLYRAWLDLVLGEDDAYLIVDSKTSAPTIAEYDNPRAATVYLMHNSHLVGSRRPWDVVKESRRESLAALPLFDATVVLSERQRDDVVSLLGTADRIEVVPNAAPLPSDAAPRTRLGSQGMAVGSLDARKRIDHAVEAVCRLRERGTEVTFDVYGDGPARPTLETRAASSDGAIRVLGFRPDAVDAFATASFFTLTSTTEGFPLVLAEGMSRGCIPISYDIPYGPADIVADGVSGFLVPPGDVEALADAMKRVVSADESDRESWRAAAIAAAQSFSDETVTARWARVLTAAHERRRGRGARFTLDAVSSRVNRDRTGATATVNFRLRGRDVSPGDLDAAIAVHGITAAIELRRPAEVSRTLRRGVWRATARFDADAIGWIPEDAGLAAVLEARIDGRLARTV